jgi:uncharacterized protein YodC (DUF2158 family)
MSFEVGDIVRLRSGGPQMTVTGTSVGPDRPMLFRCSWFDKDGHEQTGAFPAEALSKPGGKPPRALPDMANTGQRGGGTPWSA